MDLPASRVASFLFALVAILGLAAPAFGQAASADYTDDLPSVDRVKAEIKGTDPTDTLARQTAVFSYLNTYVYRIAYNRSVRGPYTAGETRVMTAYQLAGYQITQDYTKSHTPEQAKAFVQLAGQYEMNSAFYADWSKRLIGPQSAAAYKNAENQLAAGQRAHIAQEQQQYQQGASAQQSGKGGLSNDPTAVATRRCLELGGDSTACLGKGIFNGILGMAGADSIMSSIPSRSGVALFGNYKGSGTLPSINFSAFNAAIDSCGKLVADSRSYTLQKSGGSTQLVLDNQPREIALNLRPDGSLVGPGLITVTGKVITGYSTTTKQLYVDGQMATSANYDCNGPCTTSTTLPVYGPATDRCTIGSFAPPPPPKPASASSQDGGMLGALTGMLGTIAPPPLPGLRMVGKYASSSGMSLEFDGNSVTLDCGQAHVKAPYTVENAPAQFLIHVQNSGGPFTLSVAADNSLHGSGATAVNGRLVSGMTGDNVTYNPHSERCNLDTFVANAVAPPTPPVAVSPAVPAKASASAVATPAPATPVPPAGVKIAISSSFPNQPNPMAGKIILLMTDRFDNVMRAVGVPVPAGTTPGQALQAWTLACMPPKDCKSLAPEMAKYYVGRAVLDNNGNAVMTAPVQPGHYFVFGSAKAANGALIWDVPTDLKSGDNAIALSPANAELLK